MADIESIISANREALDDFIAAAERCEPVWTTPRAPGKWSPSQLAEHVAMALEEAGNVITERPAKLPSFPFFMRPLARVFLKRVVKTRKFPKAKTNRPMDPVEGPATVDAARTRLQEAMEVLARDCRARMAIDPMCTSTAFGRIAVTDYATFIELHTRHHTKQMVPPQA